MNRKNQINQKITALYCRLSLEDSRENESMSISNQKLMLRDYAEKNGIQIEGLEKPKNDISEEEEEEDY